MDLSQLLSLGGIEGVLIPERPLYYLTLQISQCANSVQANSKPVVSSEQGAATIAASAVDFYCNCGWVGFKMSIN